MSDTVIKTNTRQWKNFYMLLLIACLAGSGLVLTVHAETMIPTLPCEFYGNVSINGTSAPPGTVISAYINGQERSVMTSTVQGSYGSPVWFEERLLVTGTTGDDGLPVTFKINGVTAKESGIFKVGDSNRQDLNIVLSEFPKGDFNHNWYVDIGDVSVVAYMVVNRAPSQIPGADFNGNGFVDIGDASKISWFKVGKVTEL